MKENKLADLSMAFSVDIINFCETIKGHHSLTNQLERCATSIGANIHEANYAHSRADFISKLQISLKECYETEYWLNLFAKVNFADENTIKSLYNTCGTIRRILVTSINTAKTNQ
ncbi:MAG: four helix bundle protein [Ruminococcaceae bacterium]|nr:four helix bundle protein [Oscillospiraceae bacterium]